MGYTYKREDLNDKDVCMKCGKPLSQVNEIHTSEGMLFCSEECCVNFYIDEIIINAKESAQAMYRDFAEIVTREDIGIEGE